MVINAASLDVSPLRVGPRILLQLLQYNANAKYISLDQLIHYAPGIARVKTRTRKFLNNFYKKYHQ